MYYVYILVSKKDGRTYTGYTRNLNERVARHNSGQVRSTKYRTPFAVLHSEILSTKEEAKQRELWWKSSGGRKELKKLFESL